METGKLRKIYFIPLRTAHNLFANLLVERGWLGVCVFTMFLLALLFYFSNSFQFVASQFGILTLCVIIVSGLGQSALHVEHGQLALLCLAFVVKDRIFVHREFERYTNYLIQQWNIFVF